MIAHAQMNFNGALRFGNEWINYNQSYFKMLIAEDGMYRIPFQTLAAQGIDVTKVANLQLFAFGDQIPIYIGNDYIEFFGSKHRNQLDRFLYPRGEKDILNPTYSAITDTSAYFLTFASTANPPLARYQTINNDLNNLPAPEPWFWRELLMSYNNGYAQPVSGEVNESAFEKGEGYAQGQGVNSSFDLKLVPLRRFSGNLTDSLEIRMAGFGNNAHRVQLTVNNLALDKLESYNYQFWQKNYAYDRGTTNDIQIKILDQTGQLAIGTIRLKYAAAFNFDNQAAFNFKLAASAEPQYLEIENFNAGNANPILYDLTNQLRIETKLEGSKVKVKLPASSQERTLLLISPSFAASRVLTTLIPVRFTDYSNTNAEYLIISSERLRQDSQGKDWVQAYAAYRASSAGGDFDTLTVNVENLYDQFAYGIHRHPLSIRNFVQFAKARWRNPRYLFLIGKGITFNEIRSSSQLSSKLNYFYVPTLGAPGADNLMTAANNSQVPILPIGRLAAAQPAEIALYLEKLQQYENIDLSNDADRAWRKQVIHLGGGGNPGEQAVIRRYLTDMENILSNNGLGARVDALYKTSLDPIQRVSSAYLNGIINKGAAIITTFGHAGTDVFDFSLDDPSTYENDNRYHIMVSLSCYNGNYHFVPDGYSAKSASENFIFQKRKGAIAFLATTGFGEINTLGEFQKEYYRQLGDPRSFGKSIGEVLKTSLAKYDNFGGTSWRSHVQQFSLHGDPALVILPFNAPDYLIEPGSVKFESATINTLQDSFAVAMTILNIGKNVPDSILLEIERELPDGSKFTALKKWIATPRERSQLSLRLPTLGINAIGKNYFSFTLNGNNAVIEAPLPRATENNRYFDRSNDRVSIYITDNSALPIYPTPFAIVNNKVKLQASTINPNAPTQRYIFELDTTAYFNSPFKQKQELAKPGGMLEWTPNLSLRDSTVYYWRISPDSTSAFGYLWSTSSFIYIPNHAPGWNQSHYFQFGQNRLSNVELPESSRKQEYLKGEKSVRVITGVYPTTFPKAFLGVASYDYHRWNPMAGIYVFVLDSLTGVEWINRGSDYGSYAGWSTAAYPFPTTTKAQRKTAINFLKNVIPAGNYVLVFTVRQADPTYTSYKPEEWASDANDPTIGTDLFTLLEQQGADSIRTLATAGSKPYFFFYKKDDPNFIPTEKMTDLGTVLDATAYIRGNWDSGSILSTTIGPARRWSSLHWQQALSDEYDRTNLELYGVRADSSQVLLVSSIAQMDTTLSWIQPDSFPLIRLKYTSEDKNLRTAPQLHYWRVLYEGLPDAALMKLQTPKDTMQQGEQLPVDFIIANASDYDMDSLLVNITITDENNAKKMDTLKLKPLLQQDTLAFHWKLDTRNLSGKQKLFLEINPTRSQRELYFFNNTGLKEFFVVKDQRNPLLDVTFDGLRIMDGDIISPRPYIVMNLRDENRFLYLQDSSAFKLILEKDNGSNIPVNTESIRFYPAQSDNTANTAKLEWTPAFQSDGTYTLTVQAQDVTGNASGKLDYKVSFKIITAPSISNVLNYPNPFSTSTRFVYTLTGEEPPADFKIQIMTISGRIVRELSQTDLGPLRIGTHQTENAWDGTDEYGNRLANGVYLYRLLARDRNGKALDKYENGNDTERFFKNNIGKLVILR